MKNVYIIAACWAAFLVFPGAAGLAQSGTLPPDITVEDEPPGDNCEFGGVKVTVTPAEEEPEPTPEPTEEPTPDPTATPTPEPTETPAAEPEIFYVCNGQQGMDFAVIDTCEEQGQMEGEIPFPEG